MISRDETYPLRNENGGAQAPVITHRKHAAKNAQANPHQHIAALQTPHKPVRKVRRQFQRGNTLQSSFLLIAARRP